MAYNGACGLCPRAFRLFKDLREHVEKIHKLSWNTYKARKRKGDLPTTMLPLICPLCGVVIRSGAGMYRHIRLTHKMSKEEYYTYAWMNLGLDARIKVGSSYRARQESAEINGEVFNEQKPKKKETKERSRPLLYCPRREPTPEEVHAGVIGWVGGLPMYRYKYGDEPIERTTG